MQTMPSHAVTALILAGWCALGAGCSDSGDPAGSPAGSPALTLVDSIVLQESDTALVGRVPHKFTVDESGRIYLADQSTDRLLVFGRDGSLIRTIGRHGGGPGEFQRIAHITIPHGPYLLQGARGTRLILLDSSGTQEFNRFHHGGYMASWASSPRWLILGINNPADTHVVVVASWDSLVASPQGARLGAMLGTIPRVYEIYPGIEIYNQVAVAIRNDTVMFGFGPTDLLVRVPLGGGVPDTVQVPRRFRRPVTRSALARYRTPSLSFHDALTGLPNLQEIWLRSDGHVVLWFQEGATEDARRENAEIIGHAIVTVLSPDFQHACGDARIDAPGTRRTRLAFSRDTIYSFDQIMDPAQGARAAVQTVLRRYAIALDGCEWLPTRKRADYF